MRLSEADDGREIEIAVDATLELALPEVSGTGFRWAFTARGESVLALENEYTTAVATAPGGGRMRCWRFKAIAPGHTTLALGFSRPWEKSPPAHSFSVKLHAGGLP
jgi:predicted secreted protein